ncbi:DUF1311 domain-containing protein [Cronobacter dublinensis]|uniref:lysozyme inhibitor LprI family protein n=1 Tax=Cronobacter dublinensis TaxID=413497 RepID=UPI0024C456B3|nr:DUF1311 domain-containing protein [Cronobacter dublinensis]MDK1251236.1 DUF1311 domain-containing protein [Cronobacter dublinensis]
MKIKHCLFGFLFFYSYAHAIPFFKGDEIPQCLALPHAEDTQQKCKENALKASEQALVKTVEQLQAMIDENYDDPFTLDADSPVKISEVFKERFSQSQTLWLASRDQFCSAKAALVGEWAQSQSDIMLQCIIDLNKARAQEIKTAWTLR